MKKNNKKSKTLLYDILEIQKESKVNEIRKAYYKLALKLHPDRLKTKDLQEIKKCRDAWDELKQAYDILMDPEKRKHYDRTGRVLGDDTNFDVSDNFWNAYNKYKEKAVTQKDIDAFILKFQNSNQEEEDLINYFNLKHGDITHILSSIVGSTNDDIERYIQYFENKYIDNKLPKEYLDLFNETKQKIMTEEELDQMDHGDDEELISSGSDDDEDYDYDDGFIVKNRALIKDKNLEYETYESDEYETDDNENLPKLKINQEVKAKYNEGQKYYNGKVSKVYKTKNVYDILYDEDEYLEKKVKRHNIKGAIITSNDIKKRKRIEEEKPEEKIDDMEALRAAILGKNKKQKKSDAFDKFAAKYS